MHVIFPFFFLFIERDKKQPVTSWHGDKWTEITVFDGQDVNRDLSLGIIASLWMEPGRPLMFPFWIASKKQLVAFFM